MTIVLLIKTKKGWGEKMLHPFLLNSFSFAIALPHTPLAILEDF